MNPPPIPKRHRTTALWTAVVILAVLFAVSFLANLGMIAGRSFQGLEFTAGGGMDEFPQLTEHWSYGSGDVKAVRVPLSGLIFRQEQSGLFGPRIDKVQEIKHQIRAATNDDKVRAIVFEVDSPGGGITPSDEIYHALRTFKQSREDRVVLAFTRDLAASGGYYAAVAADWIIAEPTSIVGSIGVLMQSLNWKRLTDDIGLRDVTIASGENKDMLNPFQEISTNQVELLQNMIDTMHTRFQGIVQGARNLSPQMAAELSDGRIFTADQALDYKLIDQIGYWEDVVRRTCELCQEDSVRFVSYHREMNLFSLLAQARLPFDADTWSEIRTPKMMYLWRP